MIPRPAKGESAALDTMIWIYGHDQKSKYFSCCRKVRNLVAGGEFRGVTTHQTLAEIVNAVSNPRSYVVEEDCIDFFSAFDLVKDVISTPNIKIVLPTLNTLSTAMALCRKYDLKRRQWFDALLAATLLDQDIRWLYTMNDKDFYPIKELGLINPFTETLRPFAQADKNKVV